MARKLDSGVLFAQDHFACFIPSLCKLTNYSPTTSPCSLLTISRTPATITQFLDFSAMQFTVTLLVLALVAAISHAFVPTTSSRTSSALRMDMSKEMSASSPFLLKPKNLDGMIGNAEFDPLGFAENFDPKWLREAELKHGRVSMLAVVGWLAQMYGPHLPSPDGIYDKANPIDAFFAVGPSPIAQIFITIGALESINHNGKMGMTDMHKDTDREVGRMSLPFYGAKFLDGKSDKEKNDMKLKEIKNGRLAMCAIGGLVHHAILEGSESFGKISILCANHTLHY